VSAPADLSSAFTAALPRGARAPAGDLDGLLRALFEAGRAAWPGVELDPTAFARHLGRHAAGEPALPPAGHAADVYLACACAAGAPAAVATFDRRFSRILARAVGRVDPAPAFVEDALQTILEHLLVSPPGAPPRIAEYAGRAPLRAWLAAVAVRTALNLRRRRADQPHDALDEDGPGVAAGADPELGYMKAVYKDAFEAAVRAALARISPEERALLRLHLTEGMSIDRLAERYAIGRSTAARRLASARAALREHTRAELEARLGLTRSGMDSIAALVRSQLEVSASGLLAEDVA
jgi:RNA polymerase sigma-70 factor (ECF subfamily)